jgi:hypothetical protein
MSPLKILTQPEKMTHEVLHGPNEELRARHRLTNWILIAIAILLALIFLEGHGWAQAGLNTQATGTANFPYYVICSSGCSGGSGGGGTSSNFGAAFPAAGTAIGAMNGGNMVGLAADGSNNLLVNINAQSLGKLLVTADPITFASPQAVTQSGTWNVTNAGTFAVQAAQSGSWSVSVSNFPATQPVSAASLPLPSNAAQEAGGNLATLAGAVSSSKVNVNLSSSTLPSSILAGQQAVTASAVALASNALTRGLCVEALSTNTISVYVGPSGVTTATGIELPAGSSFCPAVSNSNEIYVIASTTGATVTWSGN